MRNTLAPSRRFITRGLFAIVLLMVLPVGCTEFVHWGHVSDRDNTWGVGNVEIAQQQAEGGWRVIGGSDGKGRYEVFKSRVGGGGKIRMRKTGYYDVVMEEAEFLQTHQVLMQSGDNDGGLDSSRPPGW